MSYKEKPQLKLYSYINGQFKQQAIIDDYESVSIENNLYQAGQFLITINYNIPNASLFQRKMFIQFGNDPYNFGEIYNVSDAVSPDGKEGQKRTISGYDARYLFKRRIIKNLNSNDTWNMTAKGEICLRSLIYSEAGEGAEAKRRLPINNIIPAAENALGKEYTVSESYTNLYDVLCTIATQSEIGWRVKFDGELTLEVFNGEDISDSVFFSTDFESLANGNFNDTSESFTNAVYVGGKGDGSERDIYEGESAIEGSSPSSLDRFESWDNQSELTNESEYENEALSILSQYGQNLVVNGNGLAKCPYVFKEQYNIGDTIKIAFSGKSANVQILSVIEYWQKGNYQTTFSFGKPQNNFKDQLQLILKKIQIASNKANAIDSVIWYEFSDSNLSQDKKDVTFNSIGFTGTLTADRTFTFHLDDEGTGSKIYNIYAKNLVGNFNVNLTTGKSDATNVVIKGGVNLVARVYVDVSGNVILQSMSSTDTIESGNNQPATSNGVATAISDKGLDGGKTDNAIARWDGTEGKLQNSGVTINDSNVISGGTLNNASNVASALSNGVTCSTAAGTAAKTVSLTGFVLRKGAKLLVNVVNTNTATGPLTLNVNGTGAKTIREAGKVTSATSYTLTAGWYNCYYDGTYWSMDNAYEVYNARISNQADYTRGTALCPTAAATAAKVAVMLGYTLSAGNCFPITFYSGNTANSMTLNINSTGAKPVYLNGKPVSSSNKTLNSGTYLCLYDGSVYHIGFSGASTEGAYGGLLKADKWSMGTSSGYIKFSNGLIIQWGTKASNTYDVAFNIEFNTACIYFNFIAQRNSKTSDGWHYYHTLTKSGVKVMSHDEIALWLAIGY